MFVVGFGLVEKLRCPVRRPSRRRRGQFGRAPFNMSASTSTYVDNLQRVMPTIFVAGPAKSGSTFLWQCVHHAFHPQRVCDATHYGGWSDARCGSRRFVLPSLVADASQPACLRFEKESSFWRYWGRRPQMTWQRYGGPRLPLSEWEMTSARCGARKRAAALRSDGPRQFAGHRALEDACLQDLNCPSGRVPYASKIPDACMSQCSPCTHHPGWMDNYDAACPIPPYKCSSNVCADAPYVPKALRRQNYSGHHARAFVLSAFPA